MVTNILIGVGSFMFGCFVGTISVTKLLINVNKLYKEKTGNDFVTWLYDESNTIRKKRLAKAYAED